MQPAPWLPHGPMRSRQVPLHATILSVSPTLDLKQMIAGFVCLLLFLCSLGGFASEVPATVERSCGAEGCERLARDDVS